MTLIKVALKSDKLLGGFAATLILCLSGCGGPFLAGTVSECPPNYEQYVDSVRVTLHQTDPAESFEGKFPLVPAKSSRTFTFSIGSSDLRSAFGRTVQTDRVSEVTLDFEKYVNSKIITKTGDRERPQEELINPPGRIGRITRDSLCARCRSASDTLSFSFVRVYEKLKIPTETLTFPAAKNVKNKLKLRLLYNPYSDPVDCRRVPPRQHVPGE
jgi:hypothetical protein